ncbi:MAG: hypothetical protein ACPGMR_02255 [Pontibacterium sp.]
MSQPPQVPPSSEYVPLFNRNYLLGLVWFSIIVIAALSTMKDSGPALYDFHANTDERLYTLTTPSNQLRLELVFPVAHGASLAAPLLGDYLIKQTDGSTLALLNSRSIRVTKDSVVFVVDANAEAWQSLIQGSPAAWLTELTQQLCAPASPTIAATLTARAQAGTLINQQQNSKQLQTRFLEAHFNTPRLSESTLNSLIEHGCRQYSLALFGAKAMETAKVLRPNTTLTAITKDSTNTLLAPETGATAYRATPVKLALPIAEQRIRGEGANALWAFGLPMANLTNHEHFSKKAAAILASQVFAQTSVSYRLLWQQGREQSYYLWVINSPYDEARHSLTSALSQLNDHQLDEQWDTLRQQWLYDLDSAQGQWAIIEQIAAYQLNPALFPYYAEHLNNLNAESLRPWVEQYLSLDNNTQVMFE